MHVNFDRCGRIFQPNYLIISIRVNDRDPEPDSIWICWDRRLWEIREIVKHSQFIHYIARNKDGLNLFLTMVYGSNDYRERNLL